MAATVKARRFEGNVALVTAATAGIGLAIASRLGREGASVVICSRKEQNVRDALNQLKREGCSRVEGMACHIARAEDRQKIVQFTLDKFGRIDVLVNNHGINPIFGDILDVEDSMWDKLFETNVKAGWQMAKLVVPHMRKTGTGGSIIFNASYVGYRPPSAGLGAYAVTKTAMLGLVKALAGSLAKDSIRVNGIAPGIIKTKLSSALWDSGSTTPESEAETAAAQEILLGRLGVPNDCAGLVAFLASEDAGYITGETVVVAGGLQCRL